MGRVLSWARGARSARMLAGMFLSFAIVFGVPAAAFADTSAPATATNDKTAGQTEVVTTDKSGTDEKSAAETKANNDKDGKQPADAKGDNKGEDKPAKDTGKPGTTAAAKTGKPAVQAKQANAPPTANKKKAKTANDDVAPTVEVIQEPSCAKRDVIFKVSLPAGAQNKVVALFEDDDQDNPVDGPVTVVAGGSQTLHFAFTPNVGYSLTLYLMSGGAKDKPLRGFNGTLTGCNPDPEPKCTKVPATLAGLAKLVNFASNGPYSGTFSRKADVKEFCTPITPYGELWKYDGGVVPDWNNVTGLAKFPQNLVERHQPSTTLKNPLTVTITKRVCQGQTDFGLAVGGNNVGNRVTAAHHHGNVGTVKNLYGKLVGGTCPSPTATVVVTKVDCYGKYKVTVTGANITGDFNVALSAGGVEKIVKATNGSKTYTNTQLGLPNVGAHDTLVFKAVWGKGNAYTAELKRPKDCEKLKVDVKENCDKTFKIIADATDSPADVPVKLEYKGMTVIKTVPAGQKVVWTNTELSLPENSGGAIKVWYGHDYKKTLPDVPVGAPKDCVKYEVVCAKVKGCPDGTLNGEKMVLNVTITGGTPKGDTLVASKGGASAVFKLTGNAGNVYTYTYNGAISFIPNELKVQVTKGAKVVKAEIAKGLKCEKTPPGDNPPPNNPPPYNPNTDLPLTGAGVFGLVEKALLMLMGGVALILMANRRFWAWARSLLRPRTAAA